MLFVFRGAQLLQQQSQVSCMHSVGPLVIYKLNLPAEPAQAWWNRHILLLAATAHVENTQAPQLQVDNC